MRIPNLTIQNALSILIIIILYIITLWITLTGNRFQDVLSNERPIFLRTILFLQMADMLNSPRPWTRHIPQRRGTPLWDKATSAGPSQSNRRPQQRSVSQPAPLRSASSPATWATAARLKGSDSGCWWRTATQSSSSRAAIQ